MLSPVVRRWLEGPELKKRRSAVLFGVEAHVCVQQTALDLLEQGRDVHILADGVSSKVRTDSETALVRMMHAGAFVTTSEAVLMELMRGDKHKHFTAICQLIKEEPEGVSQ